MTTSPTDISNDDLKFNSDVMSSIQSSVTLKKPLMLFIKNIINTDNNESDLWIDNIILKNSLLSHFTKDLLLNEFIRLEIVKDSIDFKNLISIMPSFQNAVTPCIFFIYSGQIIDIIPKDTNASSVDEKIKFIHQNLQNINGRIISQQSIPSNQSPIEIPNQQYNQSEVQQQSNLDPSIQSPPSTHVQSNLDVNIESSNINRTSNISNNETDRKNNSKPKKSLKEESAEFAAMKYRENLLKQQKQAKLDRERILNLLELDRKELKNNEKQKVLEYLKNNDEEIHVHENLHNSKIQNSSTYTIQLKLLDGSTIRHQFKSNDKLLNVREFVLETYPDYNSFPFYFFKNIDRITFGDADENKSLMSLNLNRSTLILKPIEPEENKKISVAADNQKSSTFGWLKNRMYSYLWSSESNNSSQSNNDRQKLKNSTLNSHNSDSSYNSPVLPHSQQNDDESDNDTIYHTPLLSSTTPSTTSLRPTMSNFNLYGSQGLIQPASSIQSSTNDLVNLHQSQNLNEQLHESNHHYDDNGSPNLAGTSNSINGDQNIDRNIIRTTDDIDVNNGNSISLQFPDDD